ncbi:MAG TPA: insulinase family protein [Bacteroidia bacterium]|nr:insulinase family protein [Bacteroidia bacterium]
MKKISITVISLLSALSLSAQQPASGFTKSIKSASQQIKQAFDKIFSYDSIPGDPFHIRIYTFPNGLKVYLSPYHAQPKIFTMIAVKAGSKYDPADATGLAHYLEHMLFKGTDKYGTKNYEAEKPLLDKIEELFEVYRQTKDETQRKKIYHQIDSISFIAAKYAIANEYDKMATGIGANSTNAFTDKDETVYINEIPSNQVDNWLDLESERFRNPVFRLFHTELEAVYEEKNRSLDNDEYQMYEALYKELFPNHPYGTQTTIGTVEHLKNPSLREIKKYYEKYYVPNNMAIIMCGDFNPDTVIRKIFARFANKPSKPVEPVNFTSPNLSQRIQKTIYGPKSEMLIMGWKADGAASKDALYLELIKEILYNSKSGLIDVNVNGKQKVLSADASYEINKDYSNFTLFATPKENQTLEEVEKILLEEIHKLQNGEFDEQLLKDILTNKKLELQKTLEDNFGRAFTIFSAFTKDMPLQYIVNKINEFKKITKQDIMHFAQQYLRDNNYAVIYKKTGESQNIKVSKPAITPVELDRENISEFAKQIINNKPKPLAPKFLDYQKDIQFSKLTFPNQQNRSIELLYNQNKENELFELTYYYNLNSNELKKYSILFEYLNKFPSTESANTDQIFKRLYQIGCDISWYVSVTNNEAYVTISGLAENIKEAVAITEAIINQPKINEETFKEFINDLIKEREDNKKDKNIILRNLSYYATFGEKNPVNDVLTNEELKQLSVKELEDYLKKLHNYPHQILFYGPQKQSEISNILLQFHKWKMQNVETNVTIYPTKNLDKAPKVFFTPYPMQQAELVVVGKVGDFNSKLFPSIVLFNNYFGGSMSGVIFQEIRESRALAYAANTYISTPPNKQYPITTRSYIGTQADKLPDALPALYSLLDSMPFNKSSFDAAKEAIVQQIRSERIIKTQIFFNYLYNKKLGLNYDIRKDVFQQVPQMNFKDLFNFQKTYISKKPRNIAIIGDPEKIDKSILKKYGDIQEVSLKEIFGY